MKLAEKLLLDKFHVGGSPIDNAHRTGKAVQGHPRHVIARFYSRVTRMDVLHTARAKLSATKIRIVDDLTLPRKTFARRTVFAHLWTNYTNGSSGHLSEMVGSTLWPCVRRTLSMSIPGLLLRPKSPNIVCLFRTY